MVVSLKPFVLLSDECYAYLHRITKAEAWMKSARQTVFMETSFPVIITANVQRTAVKPSIMEEFFHLELIDSNSSFGIPSGMGDLSCYQRTVKVWAKAHG